MDDTTMQKIYLAWYLFCQCQCLLTFQVNRRKKPLKGECDNVGNLPEIGAYDHYRQKYSTLVKMKKGIRKEKRAGGMWQRDRKLFQGAVDAADAVPWKNLQLGGCELS